MQQHATPFKARKALVPLHSVGVTLYQECIIQSGFAPFPWGAMEDHTYHKKGITPSKRQIMRLGNVT